MTLALFLFSLSVIFGAISAISFVISVHLHIDSSEKKILNAINKLNHYDPRDD